MGKIEWLAQNFRMTQNLKRIVGLLLCLPKNLRIASPGGGFEFMAPWNFVNAFCFSFF